MVLNWFHTRHVNILNIITLAISMKNRDTANNYDIDNWVKYIIDKLLEDGKILRDYHYTLNTDYSMLKKEGMLSDFVQIIEEISENPNIINPGKWVPPKRSDLIKNRCIPCSSRHRLMFPMENE